MSNIIYMDTKVGFHVSIAGGISNSVDNALKIGCKLFKYSVEIQGAGLPKPLEVEDVKNFQIKLVNSKIRRKSVFVHMPYLPNLSALIAYYTRNQLMFSETKYRDAAGWISLILYCILAVILEKDHIMELVNWLKPVILLLTTITNHLRIKVVATQLQYCLKIVQARKIA